MLTRALVAALAASAAAATSLRSGAARDAGRLEIMSHEEVMALHANFTRARELQTAPVGTEITLGAFASAHERHERAGCGRRRLSAPSLTSCSKGVTTESCPPPTPHPDPTPDPPPTGNNGAAMPGTGGFPRGTTRTYSWRVVDSTLPHTVRINDRRTGTLFIWSGNYYVVKIGATSGVTSFTDGRFQCSGTATSRGNPYTCRTCVVHSEAVHEPRALAAPSSSQRPRPTLSHARLQPPPPPPPPPSGPPPAQLQHPRRRQRGGRVQREAGPGLRSGRVVLLHDGQVRQLQLRLRLFVPGNG